MNRDRVFDYEVEIFYNGSPDNELNARLDVSAEKNCGHFATFDEYKDESPPFCLRSYGFYDEEFADEFREESNLIISRYFDIKSISLDELPSRLRWSFDEAVYHHVEFEDEKTAKRFATQYRAVLGTYLEPDMFDVIVINPVNDESGHMVIWAFPVESVIPDFSIDEEFDEVEDVLNMINSKPNQKKVMN